MRMTYVLATMVALGGAAPLAVAQAANEARSECLQELNDSEARYDVVREHLDASFRRNMATLKSAAVYLANAGKDDACEEVVEAMDDLLGKRESELVSQGVLMPRDERIRRERLNNAAGRVGAQGPLRARDLIGAEVRNLQDEDLGDISDVIVNPSDGTATHVLIATGGVLGIGEDYVAVPVKLLGFTDQLDLAVLKVSEQDFENAPKVSQGRIENASDVAWRQESARYFDEHVKQ